MRARNPNWRCASRLALFLAATTPFVSGCNNLQAFLVLTTAGLSDFFLYPLRAVVGAAALALINAN